MGVNYIQLLFVGMLAMAQAQISQPGTPSLLGPNGPRPYAIPAQIAAKLQQQQHLQNLQQQQQHHQLQIHTSSHPQAERQSQPQAKPNPQVPKFVSRNSLEVAQDAFQKPRFSPLPTKVQQSNKQQQSSKEEEEDYYEDEGPDKLTLLLQKSKFECNSKKDGYYADDSLNCDVFHYCQEGKKHSWMCPENMNFHQVHLICMLPSQDNICTKSTNFHFVNEYLYRPINEKEAAATNTTLKYADRYYPQGYTPGMAIDDLQEQQPYQPRAPQRFGQQNVFFNPESVNIPLTHRRPSSRQRERDSNEYYDEK